ncbi:MAG: zf-HC2 domain-containing protein [Oscillospiraceae bacterium]|jgi:hypothetical protein|nr:zf-HC2 domain-containing protein [Oscillospiraceae bacterium]
MKTSCEIIRDLLPLYCDGVLSAASRELVEEHLNECADCRALLEKMKSGSLDETITRERSGVLTRHAKTEKRKSFVVGATMAGIFAIPILVCLIVNIATGSALDWFFIVLTALMTLASLTVVPLMVSEEKFFWTLVSFTGSLLLLLLSCCLYSGGDWFFITALSIVFGLSICFLPYVTNRLPLRGFAAENRGLLVMAADTVLLFGLIVAGLGYNGGLSRLPNAIPSALIAITLPWVLFLVIHYLRASALIRAGICTAFTGVYLGFIEDAINWIIYGKVTPSIAQVNLTLWNETTTDNNITLLILIVGVAAGALLLALGLTKKTKDD